VSTERTIVAIGGGGFSSDPASPLDDFLLKLTGAERPRVSFLATASGDSDYYTVRFHDAYGRRGAATTHVPLFGALPPEEIRERLLGADLVYVGGGNTASLLAVWRAHGVDALLREAWERGTVLGGVSAGGNCWFEACTTDSFGPIAPLTDGLAFLPGSFCPHYDAEPERRPTYRRLVADGFPAGWAAEDGVALHFAGTELREAVTADTGKRAYRVETSRETPLDPRPLR
jgi:dipeptidase E